MSNASRLQDFRVRTKQFVKDYSPGWMSNMSKVVDEAVSKLTTKVKNDETTLLKRSGGGVYALSLCGSVSYGSIYRPFMLHFYKISMLQCQNR